MGCCHPEKKPEENEILSFFNKMEREHKFNFTIEKYEENYEIIINLSSNSFKKLKNDILERNNEFIKEKQQRLEKYSNIKEKECTFKPKINNIVINTSKENSKNSNVKTEQNTFDVSKRLFDYQKKYKDNLEDMKTKFKENYTFKPIISKNTNYILNNKRKIEEKITKKKMIMIMKMIIQKITVLKN